MITTEGKNAHLFVCKRTGFVRQRPRDFVKKTLTPVIYCDWSRIESSVKNLTRVESPFFSM